MLSTGMIMILLTVVMVAIVEWTQRIRSIVKGCAVGIGGIVLRPARWLGLMSQLTIGLMGQIIRFSVVMNVSSLFVNFYPPEFPHNCDDACQCDQKQQQAFAKKGKQHNETHYHENNLDASILSERCLIGIFGFLSVIHWFYLENFTVFASQAFVLLRRVAILLCCIDKNKRETRIITVQRFPQAPFPPFDEVTQHDFFVGLWRNHCASKDFKVARLSFLPAALLPFPNYKASHRAFPARRRVFNRLGVANEKQ